MTRRPTYEELEQRVKELEKAADNRGRSENQIGTLAGGIAHDLNNILFSIIGNTEMSMDEVPEGSMARSNMQEVLTAAKRARDMVRQSLDFSLQSVQERKPLRVQPIIENNAEVPPETVSMESIPGGNEHILLVDDEENIVRMVQQMLERFGYQVTAQTSSIEALEAFRKLPEKFDIIITDQTMPNMTGEELAKALIQMRPDIPVILCTGFGEIIPEEKARAIGIKDYIMKPVLKSELAKSVRRVLDAENEK